MFVVSNRSRFPFLAQTGFWGRSWRVRVHVRVAPEAAFPVPFFCFCFGSFLGAVLGLLGAVLGGLGTVLGSSWGRLGASWSGRAVLGPEFDRFGVPSWVPKPTKIDQKTIRC